MKHNLTGYVTHKCRCEICSAAARESRQRSYLKNRDKIRARNDAYAKAHPEVGRRAMAKWKATYPERAAAIQAVADKKHRAANLEKVKAQQKAWYDRDPEKQREKHRANYVKKAEERRAYSRAYAKANPEKMRDMVERRRARLLGADVRIITERDWRRLCARYDNKCAYCGAHANLTQDHIVPLIRGGRHAIGNLIPACKPCNSSKRTSLLIEWRGRRISPATNLIR